MSQITLEDLEDGFKDLRKDYGCQVNIARADTLTEYLDYDFISQDHKISCIITLIRHSLSNEQAWFLMASLNLILEYKNIPNPQQRRMEFQKDIMGTRVSPHTLLNKDNKYINELAYGITKLKANGDLVNILNSASKELFIPTLNSIKNTVKTAKERSKQEESPEILSKDTQRAFKYLPMDLKEAVTYLLAKTKIEDQDEAADLAKRLSCFPLALELATACIKSSNIDPSEYLRLMERYGLSHPRYYYDTIRVVWRISMDQIHSDSAKQLLFGCAYLAPDAIDLSILVDSAELAENAMVITNMDEKDPEAYQCLIDLLDDYEREEIVNELSDYALIKTDEEGLIYIPSLLQEIIREEIGTQTEVISFSLNYLEQLIIRIVDTAGEVHDLTENEILDIDHSLTHLLSIANYAESLLTKDDVLIKQLERAYIAASTADLCLNDQDRAIGHIAKALSLYKNDDSLTEILGNVIAGIDWSVRYGPAFRKFTTSYQMEDNQVIVKIESKMDSYANNPPEPKYLPISF